MNIYSIKFNNRMYSCLHISQSTMLVALPLGTRLYCEKEAHVAFVGIDDTNWNTHGSMEKT